MSSTTPAALPDKPSLDQLRKQAKELRKSENLPTLSAAQLATAQAYGFESWPKLKTHVQQLTLRNLIQDGAPGPVREFLKGAPRLAKLPFSEGETPLHIAAEENRPEIVQVLVEFGAPLSPKYSGSGHNALSWAITCWSKAAALKLVELGQKPDLFCASGLGLLDEVKSFWRNGELVKHPSVTGCSRYDEKGNRLPCPPEDPTDLVSDALYIACRNGELAVSRWLLDHGADPNWRGFTGGTCLSWADFSGNKELCDLLRERGARDDIRDKEFQALPREFGIMVLAGWGFGEMLQKRLREQPELLNTMTPGGTPLHVAARNGHVHSLNILLAAGADLGSKDGEGRTPADVAEAAGRKPLADALRQQMAQS